MRTRSLTPEDFALGIKRTEHAAQDLSRGTFRNGFDRHDVAELLVRDDAFRNPGFDRFGFDRSATDDISYRDLAGAFVGSSDDCDVGNRRIREQQCLELGRRYLKAFDLDQFLETIGDVKIAVRVEVTDVTGAHPTVGRDGTRRSPRADSDIL